jgi:Ras-related protein Rab-43
MSRASDNVFPDGEEQYDFLFKIVLVGDPGVGKTCVVKRYKDGVFSERQANTIGVDFTLKNIEVDGKKIKLQIWDTAGQERFRTITQSYYRNSNGVILCYDISKLDSFHNMRRWFDEVKKFAGEDILIVICGTKLDLVRQSLSLRQVSLEEAREFESKDPRVVDIVETSSKEDTNIDTTFQALASKLVEKYERVRPSRPQESIKLDYSIDPTSTRQVEGGNSCNC